MIAFSTGSMYVYIYNYNYIYILVLLTQVWRSFKEVASFQGARSINGRDA